MSRQPPHSPEAEHSVLGAMMLGPPADQAALVLSTLEQSDFFSPACAAIFGAIADIASERAGCDETAVAAKLRSKGQLESAGGSAAILGLTDLVPTAANVLHYASIVRERSIRRGVINAATATIEHAYDGATSVSDLCADANRRMSELAARGVCEAVPIRSAVRDALAQVEAWRKNPTKTSGWKSGITDYDRLTSGMQPGTLNIVAARPGMGKSAFACDIIRRSGARALYVSYEMDRTAVAHRMLCAEGRINSELYYSARLPESDRPSIASAGGRLARLPIWLLDRGAATIEDLRALATRHHARHGLDLLAVDYLQMMTVARRRHSREQEVAEISRGLRELSRDLGICVIGVSQLNRACESRDNKRPLMSDLRESGSIEQDAHTITLLYRDDVYKQPNQDGSVDLDYIAEFNLAKNRNGPTRTVRAQWDAQSMTFANLPEAPKRLAD